MIEMHPTIAEYFQNKEDLYPKALEGKYSRVFNKIMAMWGTEALETYFADLIVDKRGGRKGFPAEVAADIILVSRLHARVLELAGMKRPDSGDPWGDDRIRHCRLCRLNVYNLSAMGREEAIRCVEAGIEVARELGPVTDVFGTGDMGIGNTTPSAAIAAVLTGRPAAEVTGRGTGIDDARMRRKAEVVQRAVDLNRPDAGDGVDVLARVGGFEIGGIAGLILGAASLRRPVLVDGFISTAGALIAHALAPPAADYMIAAHRSAERGHGLMLDRLGKRPLLDLDLRLGEGTGAALAMPLVEAAARLLTEVRTFEEAAVSGAVR